MIVSENGVGKSNLLEAIRLVLDPSLSDARRLLREEGIGAAMTPRVSCRRPPSTSPPTPPD
ncbi:hypothetical protein ACF1G5_33515 [Streptomyces coeruleorubidus]|uniref:hypothetical protein n=1 Tax=Streptomyces coeruleorubidus TaxID=116188 RepID=UPI0036FA269E